MGNCCSSTSSAQQRRPSRQLRRLRQFAAANASEDDGVESQTHESDDCPPNPLDVPSSRQQLPPQQRHRQLRRQWLLKKSAMPRRSSTSDSSEDQPSEPVASPVSPSAHPLGESDPTESESDHFIGAIPITILPTEPAKDAGDMMESTATQVYNFAGTATPVSSKEMLESISTQIYCSGTSDQSGQQSATSLFDRGTLDIALGVEGPAQEEFAARVIPSTPSLNRTRLSLSIGDQKSSSTPKSTTTPRSMSTLAMSKQVQLPSPTSSSKQLPHEILSHLAASNSSRSLRTEFGTQSERSDSFLPRSASFRPPPPALTNWTASASGQASAERDLFSIRSGDATSFSAAALPEARVECAPVPVPLNATPTERDATSQRIITWLGGLGHEAKFTPPEESPNSSPIASRRASRSLSGSHGVASPTKPRIPSRATSPVSSSSASLQGSQAKLEMMAAINTGVLSRSLAIMRMGPDTSLSPSASITDAPSSDALLDILSQG